MTRYYYLLLNQTLYGLYLLLIVNVMRNLHILRICLLFLLSYLYCWASLRRYLQDRFEPIFRKKLIQHQQQQQVVHRHADKAQAAPEQQPVAGAAVAAQQQPGAGQRRQGAQGIDRLGHVRGPFAM